MPDYGSVTGFREYHTARGRSTDAYEDDDVEAAKLSATEWIDGRYHSSFPGFKVGRREQVREWPRYAGFDRDGDPISSDTIPDEVINATYELTLKLLQSPTAINVDYTAPKYKRVSIDGALSVEYASLDAWSVQTEYPVIAQILGPIIGGTVSSGLSGGVSRA